jgi:hypothetical protein
MVDIPAARFAENLGSPKPVYPTISAEVPWRSNSGSLAAADNLGSGVEKPIRLLWMVAMSHVFSPLYVVLASLSGWINREQRQLIEYLQAENKVLRSLCPANACASTMTSAAVWRKMAKASDVKHFWQIDTIVTPIRCSLASATRRRSGRSSTSPVGRRSPKRSPISSSN